MEVFELWMEGYMATGEHQRASKIGEYHAESFEDAMEMFDKENPGELDKDRKGYSIWACRIFDNEEQARAFCG